MAPIIRISLSSLIRVHAFSGAGLEGTILNQTCHSINGEALWITSSFPFNYFIGTVCTATGIIIGTQMAGLIPPSLLFPLLVTDPGSEDDISFLNRNKEVNKNLQGVSKKCSFRYCFDTFGTFPIDKY